MFVNMKYLIVITGPTAIGKTALSIDLAHHFSCEILSADSRQFFKEMSIGTAKPSKEEMGTIPHHFIDSHSIGDVINAGRFEEQALAILKDIYRTQDIAIVVGGSGLYINALCNGIDEFPEVPANVREEVNKNYQEQGIKYLQKELARLDPEYLKIVDNQNPQRMLRGLEVCLCSDKPYSFYRNSPKHKRDFEIIKIGLEIEREQLYERINTRVDLMMEAGLLDEVKSLAHLKNENALNTVGYKEFFDFWEGKTATLEEAIELLKRNTRRFAKRQITWFKRDQEISYFHPNDLEKVIEFVNKKMEE